MSNDMTYGPDIMLEDLQKHASQLRLERDEERAECARLRSVIDGHVSSLDRLHRQISKMRPVYEAALSNAHAAEIGAQ